GGARDERSGRSGSRGGPATRARQPGAEEFMFMATTLRIDDALLREAARVSGLRRKTDVVRAGLEVLIARESVRRLSALGGTGSQRRSLHRRRSRRHS